MSIKVQVFTLGLILVLLSLGVDLSTTIGQTIGILLLPLLVFLIWDKLRKKPYTGYYFWRKVLIAGILLKIFLNFTRFLGTFGGD